MDRQPAQKNKYGRYFYVIMILIFYNMLSNAVSKLIVIFQILILLSYLLYLVFILFHCLSIFISRLRRDFQGRIILILS